MHGPFVGIQAESSSSADFQRATQKFEITQAEKSRDIGEAQSELAYGNIRTAELQQDVEGSNSEFKKQAAADRIQRLVPKLAAHMGHFIEVELPAKEAGELDKAA